MLVCVVHVIHIHAVFSHTQKKKGGGVSSGESPCQGWIQDFKKGGSKNHIHNGGGYGSACPSHRGSGLRFFTLFTCSMKMNVLLTVILF